MKKLMAAMLAAIGIVAQAMEPGRVGVYCLDRDGKKCVVSFNRDDKRFFTIFSQPCFAIAKNLGIDGLPAWDRDIPVWSLTQASDDGKTLTHGEIRARQYEQIRNAWNFASLYNYKEEDADRFLRGIDNHYLARLRIALKLLGANQELTRVFEKNETDFSKKFSGDYSDSDEGFICVP